MVFSDIFISRSLAAAGAGRLEDSLLAGDHHLIFALLVLPCKFTMNGKWKSYIGSIRAFSEKHFRPGMRQLQGLGTSGQALIAAMSD
jgi:hypothetical protein